MPFFNPKKRFAMKRKEEAPAKGADTVKEWMEAHPQEYAQFAARMKTEGIGGVLKLGEDAFRLSPDFQQEVERMVTTGRFDVSSLLEHLTLSDFAENYLREKNEDHMAMAAWVKYGESAPEQVADELDKAVVAQDKRTYREMLSSLFKLFWGKFFQRVELHRRCREAEGRETFTAESFQHMLASQDENRVKRIGAWLGYGRSGMDIAHLYFALAETAEISSKVAVTDFVAALKAAYPQHSIVGPRQVQKSVNYLKNLSPNRKQYGKDEPEHRFAIDIIKTEVLLLATETAD